MTRAGTRLFEHEVTRAVVCSSFLCLCPVATELSCAHLRMAQVNKKLEICLGVSCNSALLVLSLHSYTVSPVVRTSSWSIHSDPTVSQSRKVLLYTIHNPCEYWRQPFREITMDQKKYLSVGRGDTEKQYRRPLHIVCGWTTNAVALKGTWTTRNGRHGRLRACEQRLLSSRGASIISFKS